MKYALHGFLGRPSDWKFLEDDIEKVDLFRYDPLPASLEEWARQFNESVPGDGHILIGYSLGARLALHAMQQQPNKWSALVLISCHPGIEDAQEKSLKLETDTQWGQRFLKEPWEPLLKDWNKQNVLETSHSPKRTESQYGRESLYHALTNWSSGTQKTVFKELTIPTLWIVGELDKKYVDLAQKVELKHEKSSKQILPGCGHRVFADNPEQLNATIKTFINEVTHASR